VGKKTAQVIAFSTNVGEQVATIMKNGHVVTTNTAKAGDRRIVNPSGEQYLISADKFAARYNATEKPTIYIPKAAPIQITRLAENVEFVAPWGELMQIRAGGVLATTDTANPSGIGRNDVYGIQKEEFAETYSIIQNQKLSARAPATPSL
jgi:hypothetical protein